MKVTIRNRLAYARCHRCGSLEIEFFCHQCERHFCGRHRSEKCSECHRTRWLEIVILAACCYSPTALLAGVFLLINGGDKLYVISILATALLTFLAAGDAISRILIRNKFRRGTWASELSIRRLRSSELLYGTFCLHGSGKCDSKTTTCYGEVTVDGIIRNPELYPTGIVNTVFRMLDKRRRRSRLDVQRNALLRCGQLLLSGRADIAPDTSPLLLGDHTKTFALEGQLNPDEFAGKQRQSVCRRKWNIRYQVKHESRIDQLRRGVTVMPSLFHDDSSDLVGVVRTRGTKRNDEPAIHAISFTVRVCGDEQLLSGGSGPGIPQVKSIESFKVVFPQSAGEIVPDVGSSQMATVQNVDQDQIVEWKHHAWPSDDSSVELFVNLSEPANVWDLKVTGILRLAFGGSFSGVRDIRIFDARGKRIATYPGMPDSSYELEFDLALNAVQLERTERFTKTIHTDSAEPMDNIISTVFDKLHGRSDIIVSRISEEPRRSSRAGAQIANRSWDISGRKYAGVQPIDFHIVVSGDDHLVEAEGFKRKARAEISVIGDQRFKRANEQPTWSPVQQLGKELVANLNDVLRGDVIDSDVDSNVDSLDEEPADIRRKPK